MAPLGRSLLYTPGLTSSSLTTSPAPGRAWTTTSVCAERRRGLWMNRNHDDIAVLNLEQEAQRLVAVPSRSFLWSDFAVTELDQLHQAWRRFFDAYEAGTLGAASQSRVIGPDLEVVVLQDTGTKEAVVYEGETLIRDAFVFTLRMTSDGWKVAAYGDHLPAPGWPPEFDRPTG